MNRETQSVVTILLGGLIAAITASGRFTSYVTPGFEPMLWSAAVVLISVGLVTLILGIRADRRADQARDQLGQVEPAVAVGESADQTCAVAPGHGDGHDHDRSKAPWLIMAPVLVLLLVPPKALGADSVVRSATSQDIAGPAAEAGGPEQRRTMPFDPLPGEAVGLPMTMKEFVMRTLYDAEDSTSAGTFVIEGFIVPNSQGYESGYGIGRLVISCCAADANPMQIHIHGEAPLPVDTWVRATVTAVARTGTRENQYVPTVVVHEMTTIPQPADPYEH